MGIFNGNYDHGNNQGGGSGVGPRGPKGNRGAVGPAGNPGPKGVKGDQGIQGIQGVKGDKGDKGDKGESGSVVSTLLYEYVGSAITSTKIIDTGTNLNKKNLAISFNIILDNNPGVYEYTPLSLIGAPGEQIVRDSYNNTYRFTYQVQAPNNQQRKIYEFNGTIKIENFRIFSLSGVQGVKGDPGIQGIQGLKGDKGNQGIQGLQGIRGTKGDKGDKGDRGIQGIKGDAGDAQGYDNTLYYRHDVHFPYLVMLRTSILAKQSRGLMLRLTPLLSNST